LYRAGTASATAAQVAAERLVSHQAVGFGGLEPIEKDPAERQPPLARLVGHRTARGRQLLARPPAKITFIRFHLPLHEPAALPSRKQQFTQTYPQVESGSATEQNATRLRRGTGRPAVSQSPRP